MAKKTDKAKASAEAAKQRKVMADLPAPAAGLTNASVLDHLHAVVLERRAADPALSHSARLLSRGTAKVAQKFGEEAVECLIEAVARNRPAVITESADVLYHLMVLWVDAGVEPAAVWAELRQRQGISGIAEKAARAIKTYTAPVAMQARARKTPSRKTPSRKIPTRKIP